MQDIPKDVLTKAARGDVAAFEAVYKATSGFVYNVAFRVMNNRHEAEEVTQEVFLTVYHKLHTFRFQSAFRTWLYRITMNSAISRTKKTAREKTQPLEGTDYSWMEVIPAKEESPTDEGAQEKLVNFLLQSLNPDQRACIVLRSVEGFSYQQIADALKININTVRSRIKRARESLLALRKEVSAHEM